MTRMSHLSRIACVLVLFAIGTVFLVLFRHAIADGSKLLFGAVAVPYATAVAVAFSSDLAVARGELAQWKATFLGGGPS